MYSVAVFNPLAGVGKTTLSANLGHALAMAGKKVTLVDLDPAGSLCDCLGLFRPPRQGIDQVILEGMAIETVSLSTREELHLVPPGKRLDEVEQGSEPGAEHGMLLQRVLSRATPGEAVMLIDCPSSSGRLVANALLASDMVLIPVIHDEAGAAALPRLLATVNRFARVRGRELECRIVINRLPVRRRLTGPAARFIGLAPKHFFRSTICQTDLIVASRSVGRTVFEYRPNSRSAQDFQQLADEWLAWCPVL